jgi:hypothetical protein
MIFVFAAGALLVLAAGMDLFLTVFNYDGYTSLSTAMHRGLWRVVRFTAPYPLGLSVGSAAMLPATVVMWLGLEVAGFGLMLSSHLGFGDGMYFSGGAISSLTLGDVVPHDGLGRALVTLETVVGLATFTLALGYVMTAFDALEGLEDLHGIVRRHAEDPERPSSILARHFRGGQPTDLTSLLQSLGDSLERYDRGLRRYPVVYYFHTRRDERSIPHVFEMLGSMVALMRWGLPEDEPLTQDPFLAALIDGYTHALERLRRNFVGPSPIEDLEPASRDEFAAGEGTCVAEFEDLERRAREQAAIDAPPKRDDTAYQRYTDWLAFAHRQRVVLDRVADRLGYPRPVARRTLVRGTERDVRFR